MDAKRNNLWLVLSWVWVVFLIAYIVWGMAGDRGLYGWLLDWQVERWGYYYPKLTGAIPVLVLGAPAFWCIRRREQEKSAILAAQGPAAEARRAGRNARLMAVAGLVAIAVGVGAWLLSQSVPDANAPPLPFDAATLGAGPVPTGRVQVRGDIDPDAGTGVVEQGRGTDSTTFYVGFRADGDTAKDAPFRLFIERRAGSSPTMTQAFLPDQDGWLVENGLPPLARRDLESRGVAIADPHWVLESGGGGTPRDVYYVVAAVAGILGLVFILVGLIGMAQARRRMRAAELA